ncbi:hypothetical protein [Blastococcus sp. SYSU DS0973]
MSRLCVGLPVVPDLEVLEDRVGQFDAGLPAPAVEELDLHPGPEELDHRVVVAVADAADREHQAAGLGAVCERLGAELPGLNWSEWMIAPAGGLRDSIAMPSALVTGAAVGEEPIDQPTTRREHAASMTAQQTLPSMGVLGGVGDPQLIRHRAGETPIDRVHGDHVGSDASTTSTGR